MGFADPEAVPANPCDLCELTLSEGMEGGEFLTGGCYCAPQGADVNCLHGTLKPLHCACMVADADCVELLLQKGAEVKLWKIRKQVENSEIRGGEVGRS